MSFAAKELAESVGVLEVAEDSTSTSGVWALDLREEEAAAFAIHEAKSVLGALVVNVDWLRDVLARHPVDGVADALDDVTVCCERLTGLLRGSAIARGAKK